jgi:hypothetical protein
MPVTILGREEEPKKESAFSPVYNTDVSRKIKLDSGVETVFMFEGQQYFHFFDL